MIKNIFERKLIVYTQQRIEFSSSREALAEVFPSVLVAPIAKNRNDVVTPQPINVAPMMEKGVLWYMTANDIIVGFTTTGIEVVCTKLCEEDGEKEIIEAMSSLLQKVLTSLNIGNITVVAYTPSIGIDEDEMFKTSNYLNSKVVIEENDFDLIGLNLSYKIKENVLGEEKTIDYRCQLNKGIKKEGETGDTSDCLIAVILLTIVNNQSLSQEFIKDFYDKVFDWNKQTLNTILR